MLGLRIVRCSFCRLLAYRAQQTRDSYTPRLDHLATTFSPSLRSVSTTCGLNKKADDPPDNISKDQSSIKESRQQTEEDVMSASSSSSDSDSSSDSSSDSDSEVESGDIQQKSDADSKPSTVLSDDFFAKLKKSESEQSPVIKNALKSIDKDIATAARSVAEDLPGDTAENEAELIGQLLSQYQTTEKQKVGISSKSSEEAVKEEAIVDLMKGFRRRRGPTSRGFKDSEMDSEESFRSRPDVSHKKSTGLFSGKPLGIFKKTDGQPTVETSLFEIVSEERRQRRALAYPPRNAFEEQIQWTLEGKMWTFPIDNEAGWEEEKSRGFHEHVFLEDRLEGFPQKGPIRHFMELITTALSKNPYLTVTQKHEHIDWYRQYFVDKAEVLEDRLGDAGLVKAAESLGSS